MSDYYLQLAEQEHMSDNESDMASGVASGSFEPGGDFAEQQSSFSPPRSTFRTMAAMPQTRTLRSSSRAALNPRERWWKNNHYVLEKVEWGRHALNLPVVSDKTETKDIKQRIFNQTKLALEANESLSSQEKIDVLYNRFGTQFPLVRSRASATCRDLDDYNSGAFDFVDAELLDSRYEPVQVVVNQNGDFSAATRDATRDCLPQSW